jgi:type IV secretion system protein VirD4
MRAHQLKNFLVVGLFVGILGSFLLFCTLVTSMSIYSGFSKTTSIIKSYGISKSTVYFGKFYVKLFKYNLDYGSQLDQPTRSKLKKTLYIPPAIFGFIFSIFAFVFRAPLSDFRPFTPPEKLHGDAKWATERQTIKAGLRKKKGLIMGVTGRGYLIADGYQHILLFAPTGSGKGVGFVIPNLLFWEDSCIAHDIKLENFELTSGYRKKWARKFTYGTRPALKA